MASESTKKAADSPFAEAVEQARGAAEEFTRMIAGMKFPAMPDMESLLNAHRRNMEAFSAANRIALEGAQAVARRQSEIMQQTMAEFGETVRALTSPGESPQARAARQAELLKSAYERAVTNTREIGELIQRSNHEAMELLNRRFTEAMEEVKTLVEKAGAATKG